jgi:hypothetical protein
MSPKVKLKKKGSPFWKRPKQGRNARNAPANMSLVRETPRSKFDVGHKLYFPQETLSYQTQKVRNCFYGGK